MNKEEALELARKGFDGLDEDEVEELKALINSHFDMVERVKRIKEALNPIYAEVNLAETWGNHDKSFIVDNVLTYGQLRAIVKATEDK